MISLSKKTKYGLKALEVLASRYSGGEPTLIADLASQERIPKKFLELILLGLKNKGILHSKKGKGGGYLLAKSPDQIRLDEVIRILEGSLSPLPCLSQSAYQKCEECKDEATCNLRLVMKEVREVMIQILSNTTLEDMLHKNKSIHEMYFI